MEFRKLRLAGFKSFVEPAELRIEPGLTGVVGPNGCGKSNLLEALQWVMGEGSPKSMRSGGMDDVIFAGTGQRPARSFAQVTLGLAGAAGEEIEVSRKIERGSGSDYRVNGRDTRAQDVRLLFADSATGAHSPAIVGQGRISAIIAAKPAERRMLLEEAAGIAGLHVRRREAEIRLRAAEANVARLDDVIRNLEAQANSLRRQAKVAERYRALSDKLKIAESSVPYARWKAAQAAAAAGQKAGGAGEMKTGGLSRIAP
ncbi:MAG: AAA family ATPase, partial [Sandarakinorhabdus sp.]|nr:AAA family ATPase [Sandarakinorhabdus sp.]